jgi:hypothetical protein
VVAALLYTAKDTVVSTKVVGVVKFAAEETARKNFTPSLGLTPAFRTSDDERLPACLSASCLSQFYPTQAVPLITLITRFKMDNTSLFDVNVSLLSPLPSHYTLVIALLWSIHVNKSSKKPLHMLTEHLLATSFSFSQFMFTTCG